MITTTETAVTRTDLENATGIDPMTNVANRNAVAVAVAELTAWFHQNVGIGTLGNITHQDFLNGASGPENAPDSVVALIEGLPVHPSQAVEICRNVGIDGETWIEMTVWTTSDGSAYADVTDFDTVNGTENISSLAELLPHLTRV